MSVRISVDISDAMRELRRIDDGPDAAAILKLETVLAAQFQATQQHVHVITGSLKASGKFDGNVQRHAWEGQISYGGLAPGAVHNPVDYAEIERERRPGGSRYRSARGYLPGTDSEGRTSVGHDFMAPAEAMSGLYEQAILSYLRGE